MRDAIAYKAEQVLAEEATSGISAATLAVGELLKVTASVKVSEKAKYRVNAWVLEDNIYLDKQSNNYPELNGKYDFSIHNCVLRRIAHINNQLSGVNLGGTEVTDGNSRKEFVYEFPLKDIVIENQQNVRVLITVSKAAEGSANYTIDNAISVPLNGSQAFEYN